MTTARQHIINYLIAAGGFVKSSEIHRYIIGLGYHRSSSESELSKMYRDGDVIRGESYRNTVCRLSPHLMPGASMNRPPKPKPLSVFDEYRANSQIYQMDQYLRGVRDAQNMVRP